MTAQARAKATNGAPQLKNRALFRQQCYVDGHWTAAMDGATIDVTNPATGALIGTIPALGAAATEAAVAAASAAFPAWATRTAKERGGLLRRWYELLIEHADDIATLMTAEQGKPLAEARGEVVYAASFVEWFAEEAKRLYGDII
ncbi:MAG TPA: aldehyde dehydrogenase family protein, partial [Kiloniellales bacterium]